MMHIIHSIIDVVLVIENNFIVTRLLGDLRTEIGSVLFIYFLIILPLIYNHTLYSFMLTLINEPEWIIRLSCNLKSRLQPKFRDKFLAILSNAKLQRIQSADTKAIRCSKSHNLCST